MVTGIAAGDLTQNQMGGSSSWQTDRSGASKEVEIALFEVGGGGSTERALQKAIELGADVASVSRGGIDTCDGNFAGVDEAVYQAYDSGLFVSISAGNEGHSGNNCTLAGHADNLSGFVVGALGNSETEITYSNYSSSNVWTGSSRGGIDVTTNGALRQKAATAVAAVTPGCAQYKFVYDNTFVEGTGVCATSYSQPLVAGAALLAKHFMLANGYTLINSDGALFVTLLAMTDRANSQSTYKSSGFDSLWGGGRFQTRLFTNADHSGGGWAWGYQEVRLAQSGWVTVNVGGVGSEPSWMNQFKAYLVFMEEDTQDIADIDMYVYDKDCGSGAAQLGSDTSYDTKSMVRLSGSQAAGKALCIKLHGYYMPPGAARLAHLFWYYSADVSMR
ncbi:MAG: hypothetical protein AMXMBFR56_52950 [Polyangiaceae bacterium]